MKGKLFSKAMSELDGTYIIEAACYRKKGKKLLITIAAACLCLLLLPAGVLAVDAVEYNAAIGYLESLGIPAEALSGYSRSEIKQAAKTLDAGESSGLADEILGLAPDGGEGHEEPAEVTSEQIMELKPEMSREDVLSVLGETQDIGSGIYVYVYEVDGEFLLHIPFAGDEARLGVTGEDLLKASARAADGNAAIREKIA